MVPGGDPTAEIMRFMDAAGLDGRLLTQKTPFMKGIVSCRTKLAADLAAFIIEERRKAFEAGVTSGSQNIIP